LLRFIFKVTLKISNYLNDDVGINIPKFWFWCKESFKLIVGTPRTNKNLYSMSITRKKGTMPKRYPQFLAN